MGVNLEYFVDKDGFSRPICPMREPGMVWLDGLLTVPDNEGHERMIARYARMKSLGEVYEKGLVAFNDATQSLERVTRLDPNVLPSRFRPRLSCDGQRPGTTYYFASCR